MRTTIAALTLALLLGTASAATAATATTTTEKTGSATDTANAPTKFMDPNLRLPKDSGGVSLSTQITDAPLPDDMVMGKATAPLVMVEYASMSCPHCAHFSANVLPQLEKTYIETGKMRYILR